VEDNVRLHKGWIADTLPQFIAARTPGQAAFIHIDTDVYECIQVTFDHVLRGTAARNLSIELKPRTQLSIENPRVGSSILSLSTVSRVAHSPQPVR
jgi:hypothetical protein